MSKILSIDASTEACSVALQSGDEILDKYQIAPRQHAGLILPQVEELLIEAGLQLNQLDAICCNIGPGAFTGIRIAVSIAQGLAFGADIPAIPISSLENLAFVGRSHNQEINHWLCAIDARMNEVYFAGFGLENKNVTRIKEETVIAPQLINWNALLEQVGSEKVGLVGSGWEAYKEDMFTNSNIQQFHLVEDGFPNARFSLEIAVKKLKEREYLKAEELQPMYLRNNVAEKKKA